MGAGLGEELVGLLFEHGHGVGAGGERAGGCARAASSTRASASFERVAAGVTISERRR